MLNIGARKDGSMYYLLYIASSHSVFIELSVLLSLGVITGGSLEPCHLHLVLSTCPITLVVVTVNNLLLNQNNYKHNIIVGHVG